MVNIVDDNHTQVAEPWYKSKTFWTFIVGEIGVSQVAYEALIKGTAFGTVAFGWLAATAILLQNVFLRQTTVNATRNAAIDVKETVREEGTNGGSRRIQP